MARHTPRTVWKPRYALLNVSNSSAPPQYYLNQVRGVDADGTTGIQLRNIEICLNIGNGSASLDNADVFNGFFGFAKWPTDAAVPTASTFDFQNRSTVFERTPFAVMGDTVYKKVIRVKKVTLKLGDSLYFLTEFSYESTASFAKILSGKMQWFEAEA